MKRQFFILWLLVLLVMGSFSSLWPESKKPRLYIKFKGNGVFSSGGDFGEFVDMNDPSATNGTTTTTAAVSKTRSFFQGLGGEIGLEVKKHAIGIGAGYVERYLDLPATNGGTDPTRCSFSAVPIFLFIHYKVVDKRFIKAFLTLGQGVYLAAYKEKQADTLLLKSKKNNLGFHAGISVDLKISKNLAIFVDAGYRLVSFKEIEGKDYTEDETGREGDFYYLGDEETGEYRFFIKESGVTVSGSRPAELDLKGFNLSVGIKIIF